MYYYVYRLEHIETNQFYIGSRLSKVHPSLDSYMGSMKTWKPDKTKLRKIIIKNDFDNRKDTIEYESLLIKENISNPLNENYHIPSERFVTDGRLTVKNKFGETFSVSINDPKYISGEYVAFFTGVNINKVPVRDINGNKFLISKDDVRYISGELIPLSKGRKHSDETKEKLRHSDSQQGIKNSQYGTKWIYNPELKQNKKINKFDKIPDGWINGRKQKYWN
jgi:hypothetical protein